MTTNKVEQTLKKSSEKEEKVDKYLTDIKELPPSSKDEAISKYVATVKKSELRPPKGNSGGINQISKNTVGDTTVNQTVKEKNVDDVSKLTLKDSDGTNTSSSIFTFKDIVLGAINIISIALIIFLLIKLPQKATEFQKERIEQIRNQVNPQSEFGNINEDADKASKLDAMFLDQSGIVGFVGDVEKLKTENSAIGKVTFASPKAVKDEMGLMGIPVTIELRGGWDTFGPALEKIQGLPYLFRPISVNAGPSKDDPSVLVLDYGVFLYVSSDVKANN